MERRLHNFVHCSQETAAKKPINGQQQMMDKEYHSEIRKEEILSLQHKWGLAKLSQREGYKDWTSLYSVF